MKTKLLFIIALLIGLTSYGQEFNKWSADFGIGNHNVNDASFTKNTSVTLDSHWDLGVRYNFNPTIGVGLRYARNISRGHSVEYGIPTDFFYNKAQFFKLNYNRLSLEVTVDVLDVVNVHSEIFTLLTHGGVGVAKIKSSGYSQDMGLMSGGITGVFKLSDNLGIKADYSVASHIDQGRSLDNQFRSNAEGMTSNIHSGSVGLIFYFGDKTPADFTPPIDCCKSNDTIINNYYTTNKTEITKITKEEYVPIIREYVFFDHDKQAIRESELNAIYQIYTALSEDKDSKVAILGWASDTKSSAAYNLALSERRCNKVKLKLMDMGVPEDRIVIDAEGKDFHLSKENVHDLARRVELLIIE